MLLALQPNSRVTTQLWQRQTATTVEVTFADEEDPATVVAANYC